MLTLLSVEEYLELPPREDDQRDELIEGEILLSPSAKPLHAKIVRRLRKLLEPLESRSYELATDFGCILGEYSLSGPDLAAIGRQRWNSLEQDEYLQGSPELVIEVFSPANRKGLIPRRPRCIFNTGRRPCGSFIQRSKPSSYMMERAKPNFVAKKASNSQGSGFQSAPFSELLSGSSSLESFAALPGRS